MELERLQYYHGLVFMVCYQKYTPFHVALRECNLISSMGIYFVPRLNRETWQRVVEDGTNSPTTFPQKWYYFLVARGHPRISCAAKGLLKTYKLPSGQP